jgi:fumarate reductase subunit C
VYTGQNAAVTFVFCVKNYCCRLVVYHLSLDASIKLLFTMLFSITLILVTKNINSGNSTGRMFLDLIFHALVFSHGVGELLNMANVEKFRSKIKVTCWL